jgi:hypothetical protein
LFSFSSQSTAAPTAHVLPFAPPLFSRLSTPVNRVFALVFFSVPSFCGILVSAFSSLTSLFSVFADLFPLLTVVAFTSFWLLLLPCDFQFLAPLLLFFRRPVFDLTFFDLSLFLSGLLMMFLSPAIFSYFPPEFTKG